MGYYENDSKLGDSCTINGKDAYTNFKADLIEFTTEGGDISTTFQKNTGNSGIRTVNHEYGIPNFSPKFFVVGQNKTDCMINTNRLISECSKCVIKVSNTEFEFDCVLVSYKIEETGIDEYNYIILNFSAIRRLPLVTITRSISSGSSYTLVNQGTLPSGLRIKIRRTSAISSIKINDITITGVNANTDFIIDGINGEVLHGVANAILKTDLIDFPKVNAGNNTITFQSMSNTTMILEYYPTFNM